jgi:hypothetical protein
MKLNGIVHVIGQETQVSATYKKRELVIKTIEQFSQTIMIEFSQGMCNNELDALQVGQEVNVSFSVQGREWVNQQGETKYFNSIKGWKIE